MVHPLREFAELRIGGQAIMEACRERSLCQHFCLIGVVDPIREFAELRIGGQAIMEARREKSPWHHF